MSRSLLCQSFKLVYCNAFIVLHSFLCHPLQLINVNKYQAIHSHHSAAFCICTWFAPLHQSSYHVMSSSAKDSTQDLFYYYCCCSFVVLPLSAAAADELTEVKLARQKVRNILSRFVSAPEFSSSLATGTSLEIWRSS